MQELKNIIAKNIQECRNACGLTQLELAEKLNYSDKAVSKWERGESLPDISVLKKMSEIFGVSLDYLTEEVHHSSVKAMTSDFFNKVKNNRALITSISIVSVWLLSYIVILILNLLNIKNSEIVFLYALPVSFIVWLIFNSIWFNKKVNFLIVSFLCWSCIAVAHITLLQFSINLALLYILGIPSQLIIILWSRIRYKK